MYIGSLYVMYIQRAAELRIRHRACAGEMEPINEKSIEKSMKNRGPGAPNRGPGVPKSRSRGFPEGSEAYFPCLERAEAFWAPSRVEKVANMAPT